MTSKTKSAFADKKMIGRAIKESFIKLNPKTQVQNPVMLLVYLSAILTTVLWIVSLFGLKKISQVCAKSFVDIQNERENGEFISKEDLRKRTKISKTVVETLSNHGSLNNMSEKNQLSLF